MFKDIFARFRADKCGATVIAAAVAMPVFVGGLGLGAEAGYWYFNQRKVQNAADVAAYAAASQLRDEKSYDDMAAAALAAAVETRFDTNIGTITTNTPPASGAFAGDPNAVEVIIQENVPRLFTNLFLDGDVAMSGRAVARVEQGAIACLLALDPNASGAATFTGNGNAVLEGCNVHANSLAEDAVDVSGTGDLETPCASAVGGVEANDGLNLTHCRNSIENAKHIDDPYADLPTPPTNQPCEPSNFFGGPAGSTYEIFPPAGGVRFCGGLRISRTVTMHPGLYVVDGGDFDINSTAEVSAPGVTIYMTNGARAQFNGAAEIQMTAPLPSAPAHLQPYVGILFYVDRDDPYANHILNGDSNSWFDGVIYGANSRFTISGGSTVGSGCTQIVGLQVHVTGDAGIGTDCVGKGIGGIETEQLIALVE